ncbi:helix-turn-helix transcriptional regulator [Geomonas limicola]
MALEKNGDFPARIRLGRGAVGWRLDEVEKWLNGRERVVRPKA